MMAMRHHNINLAISKEPWVAKLSPIARNELTLANSIVRCCFLIGPDARDYTGRPVLAVIHRNTYSGINLVHLRLACLDEAEGVLLKGKCLLEFLFS